MFQVPRAMTSNSAAMLMSRANARLTMTSGEVLVMMASMSSGFAAEPLTSST